MPEELSGQDLPYTNRELREKWNDMASDLSEIKVQTIKTNGAIAEVNRWRERINGGALVAGMFMTFIVMPILAWAIIALVNLPTNVQDSVNKALSAYKISNEDK